MAGVAAAASTQAPATYQRQRGPNTGTSEGDTAGNHEGIMIAGAAPSFARTRLVYQSCFQKVRAFSSL